MLKNKLNRKQFIKTGLLGGIFCGLISLFIPRIKADIPSYLNGGEYVISKDVINKLKNTDEKFNVSARDLCRALEKFHQSTLDSNISLEKLIKEIDKNKTISYNI